MTTQGAMTSASASRPRRESSGHVRKNTLYTDAINNIKLITKPGRRVSYSIKQIWKIDSNKNFLIFSTNKGLQTIEGCKKLKIGGEPFIIIN